MGCESQKYVGRDVLLEYVIGCGDALPIEQDWKRFGSLRTKEFNLAWDTTDATADDSIGALRENLATFQTLSINGDGVAKSSGRGSAELVELTKHVARPDATNGQPVVWMRITFPDITFTAFMLISTLSRSAPYDDMVSYSLEASATASDFGLIIEDTPDANAPDPTTVEAIPATLQLALNTSYDAQSVVNPPQADQRVRWSSANAVIASVNELSGLIDANALGSVNVTVASVADPSKTDIVAVTVVSDVSSINVAPATVEVDVGDTQQLTPAVLPGTAPAGVTYSSSNTAIATVSGSGLVTGVAAGTAVISVRSTFNPSIVRTVVATISA